MTQPPFEPTTGLSVPAAYQNYKRMRNFWEPVYDPASSQANWVRFDWSTQNITGYKFGIFDASDLEAKKIGPRYTISKFEFRSCDFLGSFTFCKITFNKCTFEDCDFKDAVWKDAKFSKCYFIRCSFSTAYFDETQFIECSWQDMGISSNEMQLTKVLLTNPREFIDAAYTNLDAAVLQQKSTTAIHQSSRLEKTKAKVARLLLINLQSLTDDDAYYKGVQTYTIQELVGRIEEYKYKAQTNLNYVSKVNQYAIALFLTSELWLLKLSGEVNGWGRSIGRAGLVGVGIILCFTAVYWKVGFPCIGSPLLEAIEITLLVGFTKYSNSDLTIFNQILLCLNAVLGLWWYAIFAPTLINRISRVRG